MGAELAPFRQDVLPIEKKLGFFATANVRRATPGPDSTAISNVLKDGEMMDFSADWQNTEEAPATPGDLEMD